MSLSIPPTRSSIVSAIKTFIIQKSLPTAKSLHAHIIKLGFLPETQLFNHLLNLYSKSSDFVSARELFDEMPERNLVTFSTLISGYSQSDNPELALKLISHLQKEALIPNQFVFSSLIKTCSKLELLNLGKQIHSQVIVSDYESDPFVCTNLVDFYSKLGELETAVSMFGSARTADLIMCNSMISGFVSFGAYEEAFELFGEVRRNADLRLSEFTLGSLVKACSNLSRDIGEQIHGLTLKTGFYLDCFVGTSLVSMYGELGDMGSSEKVFRGVTSVDRALYNSMIVGYSNNNLHENTLKLFGELKSHGFDPDECTFSTMLKACSGLKCLDSGRSIHGVVLKSEFQYDLVVSTALLDMYMKCGCIDYSCRLFATLSERSTVMYNSMISGQGQNGNFADAVMLFIDMKRKGIEPNHATFVAIISSCIGQERNIYTHVIKHGFGFDLTVQNALLDCLIKGGAVDEARQLFDRMRERNVISWTTIISGLCQLGMDSDAIKLFKRMQTVGVRPNSFTFSSVVKAYGNSADLEHGRCVHSSSVKHGIVGEEFTRTSLLDMYAKCGALEESLKLFEGLPKSDIVSWNTMITAYAQYGEGHKALALLENMEEHGVKPNEVTLTSLLSTCNHSGLVDEGVRLFELLTGKHGIIPLTEHYACIVDMFGRAGLLERAKCFIESMPNEPNAVIWSTYLAACKLHGNTKLFELAKEHLSITGGIDNSTLVLISNMYSESGRWDDAEQARKLMRGNGLKEPGISWLQIKR